jgi:hypothetical protein
MRLVNQPCAFDVQVSRTIPLQPQASFTDASVVLCLQLSQRLGPSSRLVLLIWAYEVEWFSITVSVHGFADGVFGLCGCYY